MSDSPATAPCLYPGTSAPHLVPPYSLLGGPENIKYLFDRMMMLDNQAALDNQANARAYAALNLRRSENAATIDHLGSLNAVISAQSGDTSDQQTDSPIRTGVGDAMASASYPANRSVDQAAAGIAAAVAESVQTNVTTQVSALSEQILALGGTITTGLQAVSDSNASIAASLASMAAALTALAPVPKPVA
jgi:hypothetical protein